MWVYLLIKNNKSMIKVYITNRNMQLIYYLRLNKEWLTLAKSSILDVLKALLRVIYAYIIGT